MPRFLPPWARRLPRSVGGWWADSVSSPLTLRNEGPRREAPRPWVLACPSVSTCAAPFLRPGQCRPVRRSEGPREGGGPRGPSDRRDLPEFLGLPAPAGHPPTACADRNESRPGPEDRAQDRETEGEGSHPEDEDRGPEHVVHADLIGRHIASSADSLGSISGWSGTRLRVRPPPLGGCRSLSLPLRPPPRPPGSRHCAPFRSDARARGRAWPADGERERRPCACPRRSRSPTLREGARDA